MVVALRAAAPSELEGICIEKDKTGMGVFVGVNYIFRNELVSTHL